MMIKPEELRKRAMESEFMKDMENAMLEVDRAIRDALDKGDVKAIVPTHMKLGNITYYDEKQDLIADELIRRGYKLKKESDVIGGVWQYPLWRIYFM